MVYKGLEWTTCPKFYAPMESVGSEFICRERPYKASLVFLNGDIWIRVLQHSKEMGQVKVYMHGCLLKL